jgi:hypothetical protein
MALTLSKQDCSIVNLLTGTHTMTQLEKGMIYELRIYHAMPGRLPALLARFREPHVTDLGKAWHPPGWILDNANRREQSAAHLPSLRGDSMAEREERWGAFLADPEWIAISTEPRRTVHWCRTSATELLAPTAFSGVK